MSKAIASLDWKSMTTKQIDQAVAHYRALLEKWSGELNAGAVQLALGLPELVVEQGEIFRRRVNAVSDLIIRKIKVNRGRSSAEALKALGRKLYAGPDALDDIPSGEGEEVEIVLFKITLPPPLVCLNDDLLQEEFELRGLVPVDPISLAALNETDPALADEISNATHWKDDKGKWCFAAFGCWKGERTAIFRRWELYWTPEKHLFAGVRKK